LAIARGFEDYNLFNNLLNDYELVSKDCLNKKRDKITNKRNKIDNQRDKINKLDKKLDESRIKIDKEGEKLKKLRNKTKKLRAELLQSKKSNQAKTYMLGVAFGVMACTAGFLYLTDALVEKPCDPSLEFTYVPEGAHETKPFDPSLEFTYVSEKAFETAGWLTEFICRRF